MAKAIAQRAGAVLLSWLALLALEHVAVGVALRRYFNGAWELWPARTVVIPIALASSIALVPVVLGLDVLFKRNNRRSLAALGALCFGALGYGVTFGRHFASLALRAPFVLLLAGVGALVCARALPPLAKAAWGGAAFAALACAALAADALVLPRLYPAFHWALFSGAVVCWGLFGLSLLPRLGQASWLGLFLAASCAAWAPFGAPRLESYDNLRMVLSEHAPLEGRALRVAGWLAPAEVVEVAAPTVGEAQRSLEWNGRDLLLISVDALRADHVGAYGYARPTTPNLDALAKEGTTFDDAYCPTPHTSYSITSMMTGKYMRPLLALGLGQDSETWAAQLRRYGYKTAGFYPPAVFFIDADRFEGFRDRGLDFEYRKEEFADPALRVKQVDEYLQNTRKGPPLFLWVHFFEPHEPYLAHPEHPFGPTDVDAYDGEIAAADEGIGAIVAKVRAARPGVIVMVTADHGEEFGEHGGRYHGTTVYEEQVRVPLVIVGEGVPKGGHVGVPVQTIDLLPTTLSALGIPRPARVRGRDLGPLLTGRAAPNDEGLAFAETDDYELYAKKDDRLVCDKRAGACALYGVATDRAESHDTSQARKERGKAMRAELVGIAHAHGKFEGQGGSELPDALRLGMQGDVTAAPEVAALLDDASVEIRRKAALTLYWLHGKGVTLELSRSLARDEDDEVKRLSALALVRAGEVPSLLAEGELAQADFARRKLAALAFSDRGDKRAGPDLAAWWQRVARGEETVEFSVEKEIVAALGALAVKAAAPDLERSLLSDGANDVRMRPYVAVALGKVGDAHAVVSLLSAIAKEPQITVRRAEAQAIVALGGSRELPKALAPLVASSEPMLDALPILREAGALEPSSGGALADASRRAELRVGRGGALVLLAAQSAPSSVFVDGAQLTPERAESGVSLFRSDDSRETVTVTYDEHTTALYGARAPR